MWTGKRAAEQGAGGQVNAHKAGMRACVYVCACACVPVGMRPCVRRAFAHTCARVCSIGRMRAQDASTLSASPSTAITSSCLMAHETRIMHHASCITDLPHPFLFILIHSSSSLILQQTFYIIYDHPLLSIIHHNPSSNIYPSFSLHHPSSIILHPLFIICQHASVTCRPN